MPANKRRSHEIELVLVAVLAMSAAATAWPADDRKDRARLADAEVHAPAIAIKQQLLVLTDETVPPARCL